MSMPRCQMWSVPSVGRRGPGARRGAAAELRGNGVPGFTLLELLVVVGLIVTLVGGIGMAVSDRSGSATAAAQQTLASACHLARAQAALHQTEARVFVYAERPPNGDPERYLRFVQVLRADPPGSNTWVASAGGIYLPRGTYVVPPDVSGLVATGIRWPTSRAASSTLMSMGNPNQPAGTPFAGISHVLYLEFSSQGTPEIPSGETDTHLFVATASNQNQLPQFNNPRAVRGVLVRGSGAIGFLNEPAAF